MRPVSYRQKTAATEIQFFRDPDLATADFDGTDKSSMTAAMLSPEGYNYFAQGFYVYVGNSGDLNVITYEDWKKNGMVIDDTLAQTMVAVAAGIWHPVRVVKILQTDTTATDIRVGV